MKDKPNKIKMSGDLSNSNLTEESGDEEVKFLPATACEHLRALFQDETSSMESTSTTDTTSRSATPTNRIRKGRRRKKKYSNQNKILKPIYKFT